jgi:hypothetical protein
MPNHLSAREVVDLGTVWAIPCPQVPEGGRLRSVARVAEIHGFRLVESGANKGTEADA